MVTFEEDSDEVRGLAVLVSGGRSCQAEHMQRPWGRNWTESMTKRVIIQPAVKSQHRKSYWGRRVALGKLIRGGCDLDGRAGCP